jgi:sulfur-carrier protein
MMRVQARLYATLRACLPEGVSGNALSVELPDGATLEDLLRQLGLPQDEVKVTFVNGRIRSRDWVLQPGDDVGVFPPIGGG